MDVVKLRQYETLSPFEIKDFLAKSATKAASESALAYLNAGRGFEAPNWSVRVSFANLDDHVYDDIGRAVRAVARGYVQAYQAATGSTATVLGRGVFPPPEVTAQPAAKTPAKKAPPAKKKTPGAKKTAAKRAPKSKGK